MNGRFTREMITCVAAALLSLSLAQGAVVHKDVSELTAESNRIVIGDVIEVTSFWNQERTLIKSRIVVEVDDYLIGEGIGAETLEMSGGTIDDLSLHVSVLPVFEPGDRVLLFLGNSEIGLVGCFQGAYLTDGEQVARMAPGCRQIFSETLRPLRGLLDEIEQALPSGESLPEVTPYEGAFELPLGAPLYALCGIDWTYQSDPMGEDYRINANCQDSPAGDASSQRTQIQNGANAWNGAGADFEFTYGGTSNQTDVQYNGTNLVYFDTTPPGGGGYVAATYMWYNGDNMLECDLVFNDLSYTWWNGSSGCYSYMDIWNIAAHEFGHFLCLDHSSNYYATMYAYVDYCETYKRSLHSDDINGIIAIYGTEDMIPPSPDPMTFESPPSPASATAITMTATLATDQTPPVQYYFDFYSGGPGGNDRYWGTTRTYTDYSLTPNTEYSYRCRARDSASPPNETAYSSVASTYTLANIPGAPELSNVTTTTIDLNVDPNANPTYTTFAIVCATSDPVWDGKFVSASGDPAVSEEWQTDDQWGTITIQGLSLNTEYSFQVKARNEDLNETAYSAIASAYTLANVPGAPELTNVTTTTIDLNVDPNANPSYTTFAIVCATSDPVWDGKFVNASGDPGVSEEWQTDDQWGTITIQGLSPNTEYSFQVKARNGDNIETEFGPQSAETTLPGPSIPTVSEWGMIIMALLLLAVGTVAVVRRKKVALDRSI